MFWSSILNQWSLDALSKFNCRVYLFFISIMFCSLRNQTVAFNTAGQTNYFYSNVWYIKVVTHVTWQAWVMNLFVRAYFSVCRKVLRKHFSCTSCLRMDRIRIVQGWTSRACASEMVRVYRPGLHKQPVVSELSRCRHVKKVNRWLRQEFIREYQN